MKLNLDFGVQAKSPVRTLDELNVTEVASTPYFPSLMERERQHNCLAQDNSHAALKAPETDQPLGSISSDDNGAGCFNGGTDVGFGVRRRHRCYVVTARAHSFLYHQVCAWSFYIYFPSFPSFEGVYDL